MDYRYLKAFLMTAQMASFSKAAESLNIAQSAVSRQIKLLEDSLGMELIIRSSKKVILTQKGKELFLAAQQFDQMAHDIFSTEDRREVRIGILQGLLKNWFRPIMLDYLKKKPQRGIKVYVGDQAELRKGLENGLYDIIFSTENIQSDLVSGLKLFDENLVLISKEEINKKKIHEYRWIVFGENDNIFHYAGKKKSESIILVESLKAIVELVDLGLGIALVPDHILRRPTNLIVQEVGTVTSSEIFMSTLNYKTMPGHIQEMVSLVKKASFGH